MQYTPSLDAMKQVFSVYGALAKMQLLYRAGAWQALVQYAEPAAAAAARSYLNGHAMYPGGANKVRARQGGAGRCVFACCAVLTRPLKTALPHADAHPRATAHTLLPFPPVPHPQLALELSMQRELHVPQDDEWGWDWTRQAEAAAAEAAAAEAAAAAAQLAAATPAGEGAAGGGGAAGTAAATAAALESPAPSERVTGGAWCAALCTRPAPALSTVRAYAAQLFQTTPRVQTRLCPPPGHAGDDFVAAHEEVVRAAAAIESAQG